MKFRKKPVVIDAVQVRSLMTEPLEFLPDWVLEARRTGALRPTATAGHGYVISTLEGTMTAAPADWLIRGVIGELYPCKPDVFLATYEPVEDLHCARASEPK